MSLNRGDVPQSLPHLTQTLSPKTEGRMATSPLAISPQLEGRSTSPMVGSVSPRREGLCMSPLAGDSHLHLWAHGHHTANHPLKSPISPRSPVAPRSPSVERRRDWRQSSDGITTQSQLRRRLVLQTIHRSWPSSTKR